MPTLRRNFGGCAGNIAYNLRLLECVGHAMGTVGHDFGPYREWMERNGMSLRHVKMLDDEYTAQAYITTDLDANQLTAFHPGAMTHSNRQVVPSDGSFTIGVCAPDGRDGMIAHADQFAAAKIPFVFDPGQAMTLFGGPELARFIEQATWVKVNDYEATLLQGRTGLSTGELAARVEAYVVTQGAEGSVVYAGGRRVEIPAVGWHLFVYLNPTSPLTWGSIFLTLDAIVCVVYTYYVLQNNSKMARVWALAGLPVAIAGHGYTGFFLALSKARAFWNTALNPALFMVSAMVSGLAVLIILSNIWLRRNAPAIAKCK